MFLPAGGLVALFRPYFGGGPQGRCCKKAASFYPIHRNLQAIGIVLNLVGAIIIIAAVNSEYADYAASKGVSVLEFQMSIDLSKFTGTFNEHIKLGTLILCLSLVQGLLGWLAHVYKARWGKTATADGDKWARPVLPSYLHVYLGWTLIVLAWVQCFWGFEIYAYIFAADVGAGYAITAVLVAVGAVALLVGQAKASRSRDYAGPCGKCKQVLPMKPATGAEYR